MLYSSYTKRFVILRYPLGFIVTDHEVLRLSLLIGLQRLRLWLLFSGKIPKWLVECLLKPHSNTVADDEGPDGQRRSTFI